MNKVKFVMYLSLYLVHSSYSGNAYHLTMYSEQEAARVSKVQNSEFKTWVGRES